ncbi:hypothetical protein ACHAWO_001042 [Cyclotella atomus]|uniref:SCP domain-containing protein n=1 Tax=Cyclotella atomus TaxID=382360 RepID=A0ABD3PPV8_9STRA
MIRLVLLVVAILACTSCTANEYRHHILDEQHWIDQYIPIKEFSHPSFNENTTEYLNSNTTYQPRQLKPSNKSPKLSSRSQSWLNSHNTRRKSYHTKFESSYVPLSWSEELARDAQRYAEKLLSSCGSGLKHDDNTNYGENLATGYGKSLVDTENVLTRWVEQEEKLDYPRNGHYTQVLWRATEFVGCGEASTSVKRGSSRDLRRNQRPGKRPGRGNNAKGGKRGKNDKPNGGKGNGGKGNGGKGNGGKGNGGKGNGGKGGSKADKDEDTGSFQCQIQVCRYARPGNCNVSKYNSFKTPMLMDESPCGPWCPPGGC